MKQTNMLPRLLTYIGMLVLVMLAVLPFVWMLSTSLKSQEYILSATPQLIPDPITFESYTKLAERIDLTRVIFNSLFVAVVGTFGQLVVASMAAYAFSRIDWRGRDTVFLLYLSTMMVPAVVLVIPQFILIRSFDWMNSYAALIVPSLFSAFGTFLLRQTFKTIPKDFEEAAFVDGANHFVIFWRIDLPLVKPALATLAVFGFMGLWNSYLWPLFVARRDEMMTLPVVLATLQAGPRSLTEWNMIMAGAIITVLPILLIYVFAQRWFVQGFISSGIKG
ncbi:MAG: carbohydrate ABC transporter permease [Phototrophicales bacterium]|nr:carbohydrate ABC transporter permease [Phototrophicales bacterium]